jgi:hypothetical protein
MALINFVHNYNDLSTDSGFQFEFCCDRCGNGYQTRFEPSVIGGVTDALEAASSMFGGLFSGAANLGHQARSATWEKAHDTAFEKAVAEAKPHFTQCSRCGHWFDSVCWNQQRGMCKNCVPDLDEEFSNIQVQAAMEQATQVAQNATYITAEAFNATRAVHCAACGAALKGGKFCPECGTATQQKHACRACGCDTQGGKFCPECGTKQKE